MPPDPNSGLGQFLGAFQQQAGGDVGNFFSGYRDMQGQIADTQVKQAEAQDLSARAEHQRMINESQKKQAQMMQQLAQQRQQTLSTAESQVQFMFDASAMDFASGNIAAGSETLEKAMKVQSQLATVKREQDQLANQQFNQREKLLADEDNIWAGINSPEDQARAAVEWTNSHRAVPGQPMENPFNVPYDPQFIEFKRNTNKAGREYLDEQRKQKAAEEAQKDKESAIRFRDSRIKLGDAYLNLRREQASRAAKGGIVPAPGKNLQEEAIRRIGGKYPLIAENEGGRAGFEIASRAMEITRSNRGVGVAAALDIAFGEAEKRGDFQTVERNYKLFGNVDIPWMKKTETKYKPKGTVASPLTLPESKKSSDLEVGKIYTDGKVSMKWNGKSWDALPTQNTDAALDAGMGVDKEGNVVDPASVEDYSK